MQRQHGTDEAAPARSKYAQHTCVEPKKGDGGMEERGFTSDNVHQKKPFLAPSRVLQFRQQHSLWQLLGDVQGGREILHTQVSDLYLTVSRPAKQSDVHHHEPVSTRNLSIMKLFSLRSYRGRPQKGTSGQVSDGRTHVHVVCVDYIE